MAITQDQVNSILNDMGYAAHFQQHFAERQYRTDDKGNIGIIEAASFLEMADNYTINTTYTEEDYQNWKDALRNEDASPEELLVACLRIIDWGGVHKGNVKQILNLYEAGNLQVHLTQMRHVLGTPVTLDNGPNHPWTAGWSKIFSFMVDGIVIYDSRVSAFLNHTLVSCDPEAINFNLLAPYLYNFGGNNDRRRKVPGEHLQFRLGLPNGRHGLNANLVASWIIQHLNEALYPDETYRTMERGFFMLGFDLDQI